MSKNLVIDTGNEEVVEGDRVQLIKVDERLKVVEGFQVGQFGTVVDINEFSFRQYPMIEWDIPVTVIGILGVWKETRTNVWIKCLQKFNP